LERTKRKQIFFTLLIIILSIISNFLFAIVPENLKLEITNFSSGYFGISYFYFWLICIFVITILSLFFVWKQTLFNNNKTGTKSLDPSSIERHVTQTGKKSVYIEKHDGDIHL